MQWDMIKDLAEILGTIGTAMIFSVRQIARAKIREEKNNAKFQQMEQQLKELQTGKADNAVTTLQFEHIKEELRDIRSDINASNEKVSNSIERLSATLSGLDGTVKTAMEFMKMGLKP